MYFTPAFGEKINCYRYLTRGGLETSDPNQETCLKDFAVWLLELSSRSWPKTK